MFPLIRQKFEEAVRVMTDKKLLRREIIRLLGSNIDGCSFTEIIEKLQANIEIDDMIIIDEKPTSATVYSVLLELFKDGIVLFEPETQKYYLSRLAEVL